MARQTGVIWPSLAGQVALVLVILVAVACAAPPQARKAHPQRKAIVVTAPTEQPKVEVKTDFVSPKRPKDQTLVTELAPQVVRRAINYDPKQLLGLTSGAVHRLLGKPSLLRNEAPAQVWQYKIADCVLDIFLYAGKTEPENTHVTYFEIRGDETAPRDSYICFAGILESRMSEPSTPPKS